MSDHWPVIPPGAGGGDDPYNIPADSGERIANLLIPMVLEDGSKITMHIKIAESHARKLAAAHEAYVAPFGEFFRQIRDSVKTFLEHEG